MRYLVAILALATPVDVEAKALAADLGTTPYEERLRLTPGMPAVVLSTTDGDAARTLLAKLRARGHRAHACSAAAVVPAASMVSLRNFQLDADGLEAGGAQLPWSEVAALVRARTVRTSETTTTVKEKKFDLGRAVLTGGMMIRKVHTRDVVTRNEDFEQVLYVFRSDGDTPWLLREHATNYAALGAALAPSSSQNFATAIARFREHAPHARFDDSLLRRPTIADVDLYAYLIAVA